MLLVPGAAERNVTQRTLVIYYANETVPEALGSKNYQALLLLLGSLQNGIASDAAQGLRADAQSFRAKVYKDIEALRIASSEHKFDLAVFTNELALTGTYLFFHGGVSENRSASWPQRRADPVTDYSSLALQEYLRAALVDALSGFSLHDRIILIINSHGTRKFAIIPRVAADFTTGNAQRVREELEDHRGSDLAVKAVEMQGITKIEFWNTLDFVSRSINVRFSLVFLDACESGVSSWREYFSFPQGVDVVAHTGFSSIAPTQIDYDRLIGSKSSALQANEDQTILFRSFLGDAGVRTDTKYSLWIWPLLVTAASVPRALYFAPMALWLLVNLLIGLGMGSRRRAAQH